MESPLEMKGLSNNDLEIAAPLPPTDNDDTQSPVEEEDGAIAVFTFCNITNFPDVMSWLLINYICVNL